MKEPIYNRSSMSCLGSHTKIIAPKQENQEHHEQKERERCLTVSIGDWLYDLFVLSFLRQRKCNLRTEILEER